MKTVLITGAAGFIGSHLLDFFLEKKFKVIAIDNFMTGSLENIKHNNSNKYYTLIRHDICEKIKIKDNVDYILHFASPASPADYIKFPIKTLEIGAVGTKNMLDLAIKKKATILVASTSEIYGDPLEHPQKESYFGNVNPVGPRGVYDEAKRYMEALTVAFKNKKKLDIRIVRIFNTYGPRMRVDDGRAIPNFINQSLNNRNFTVYGDGTQTRSFCYITDTIEGIYRILKSNYFMPINIGNTNEYSVLELINLIKKITNSNSNFSFKELPQNDPKIRKPDITLAKKVLDWTPKVELKKGLIKTIKYYKKLNNFGL
tara:strand:+ start:536 stop:1480 length:945 start_codon:yes stop_codon:yes gene_type:complete